MLSEFDAGGKFLRSLGAGLFDQPHGLRIDADDNLWTTDDKNHTVLKLSPAGKVLLVLGRRDNRGEADWLFNKPADVALAIARTGASRSSTPRAGISRSGPASAIPMAGTSRRTSTSG